MCDGNEIGKVNLVTEEGVEKYGFKTVTQKVYTNWFTLLREQKVLKMMKKGSLYIIYTSIYQREKLVRETIQRIYYRKIHRKIALK